MAALACMVVSAGTTAAVAWIAGPLLRALFDMAQGGTAPAWIPEGWREVMATPTRVTIGLGVVFAATALTRAAANYGQSVLLARIGQDTVRELRVRLYNQLLRLAPASLLGFRSGELGARVANEVLRVQSLVNMGAAPLVRNGVTAIALASLAFSLDPLLAALGLVGLPPIFFLVRRLYQQSRHASRQSAHAETRLTGTAAESAHLLPLVQAYEAEGQAEAGFRDQVDRAYDRAIEASRLRARVAPAMEALGVGAVVIALVGALVRLEQEALSPQACVSLFAAMFLLYRPVQAIGTMVHSLSSGLAALDRIDELLALPPHRPEPPGAIELPPMRESLVLENVHFGYDEQPVLRGLSLTIRAGESVAIVGPSGEGKTTLLLVMLGLLEPQRGRVRIDGTDLADATRGSRRRQFGWVGQEPLLFADTVLANIALGDDAPDRGRAERAARAAGAHGFVSRLPGGYDTRLEEGGANLSVGERQRICMARALYRDAPVLALDEPTAALDGQAEHELSETLEGLLSDPARVHTVVLASHRESTVRRTERVVVLRQGQIVEQGPPEELHGRAGSYRALFAAAVPRA